MTMLPDFVRDGFHTPLDRPKPQLSSVRPVVGQYVKVNVNFSRPLQDDFDGSPLTWALFGGRVIEVERQDRVVAVVEVTTIPAAAELFPAAGSWRVVLEFDRECCYPWVLVEMQPWVPN
jgi:hypothetical protein